MTGIQTPERLFADPEIPALQAATFAALQEISVDPPQYSHEIVDTHFQALGLVKPPILFVSNHDGYRKVDKISVGIANHLRGTIAEYFTEAGATIARTDGTAGLAVRRTILHSDIKGAGRTRAIRIADGARAAPSDTGLYHMVHEAADRSTERGAFLEAGIIRALEKEITLTGVSPKEESMVLSDLNYLDKAAQGVRTIICKDPALLNTILRARETFDTAAQQHLKSELDRVLGDGFYDTIMRFPNHSGGFEAGKNFVMQRAAEHRGDKRVKVDSFRIALAQCVEASMH